MSKLTELLQEFQAAQEAYKKKAREAFNEAVQQFFVENPEVTMLRWVQFSPYFNDGDDCVFSVHEVQCTNADPEDVEEAWSEIELNEEATEAGKWVYPEYRGPDRGLKGFDELSHFIEQNDDLMEEMFGNHAEVVITRKGIEINEYNHD